MSDEVNKHLRTIATDLVDMIRVMEVFEGTRDKLTMVMRAAMQEAGVKKFEIDGAKLVLLKNGDLSCSYNPIAEDDGETLH
jgi:hypothetical protein